MVGKSDDREVPPFFVRKMGAPLFGFESPNFASFSHQKRPNLFLSVLKNGARPYIFRKSIRFVRQKIEEYHPNAVINFYEPITGMAYAYYKFDKKRGIPMICIGHQYLLLHPHYMTTPEQDVKYYFLRMFSRITALPASKVLALSFRDLPSDAGGGMVTVPPLLREEVFQLQPVQGDYIHGYMLNSGYFEEVSHWHAAHPEVPLRFFWDKKEADPVTVIDDRFILYRLDDELFLRSMAGCRAFSTTAGFESVCEALYFQKPTLMIPVHIEQEFNAYDASLSGAGVSSLGFRLDRLLDFIPHYAPDPHFREWVHRAEEHFLREICEVKWRNCCTKKIPE